VKEFRRTRLDVPPLLAAVDQRQGIYFGKGTMYNSWESREEKKRGQLTGFEWDPVLKVAQAAGCRCYCFHMELVSLPSYTRGTRRCRQVLHIRRGGKHLWLGSWKSKSTLTRSLHRPPKLANPAVRRRLRRELIPRVLGCARNPWPHGTSGRRITHFAFP
jgi:hypothetical protein